MARALHSGRALSEAELQQCHAEDLVVPQDSWRNDVGLVARAGDLLRVRYLIEQRRKPISFTDRWDASPLFYACLGGHVDVVAYLLRNGVCERASEQPRTTMMMTRLLCVVWCGGP